MPRPPRSRGLQTIGQATLQHPLETESAPAQMNALRSLSMQSIAQEERQSATDMWTGMTKSVTLTSVVLPTTLSMFPFHHGMRAAIESMIGTTNRITSSA